jgi:hypothetical protein
MNDCVAEFVVLIADEIHRSSPEETMWKVENVKSVKNGHGFHITSLDGKPVVLFAYETQAEAKAAQAAVEKAVSLLPSASPFRLKTRYFSRRGMCGAKRADASQFR